ncbi:hypothetical protein K503DRAFT_171199 [Rhizopogon vinicolor AM-OR11-026]|uniref:Uncharacterized protein n=1 Tax=Rhizopogon vinicolor AM-OR11-026 TaxID=1314800 RepID=A0A1B7N0B8_9AGAM|nr:hypothetical protein K503DRAFT_171199 [Rhizopogon vinicolor AM-OR11-026]
MHCMSLKRSRLTSRGSMSFPLVNDDDLQNAIQGSRSISFRTFSRFLVLLLIMQRMQRAQWGMNPLFGLESGSSPTTVVKDKNKQQVDLTFI